jgi:hypothetical protein
VSSDKLIEGAVPELCEGGEVEMLWNFQRRISAILII